MCLVCTAARAQRIIAANGMEWLVGKVVNVRMVSMDGTVEHVPVLVIAIARFRTIVGDLASTPVNKFRPPLEVHDRVHFYMDAISGILESQ